ncbi:MAG: NAD(P)H-dependent oxidoreductase, partial [Actinomycetota bacterium]|nr:NAD(P)H-dependent oxidoreductase [Actinomycetota bacterium]
HRIGNAAVRRALLPADETGGLETLEEARDPRRAQLQVPDEIGAAKTATLGVSEHEERFVVVDRQGSLRRESYNTKLLTTAGELMLGDIELEIWDGLKAVPPYDEEDARDPAPAGATQRVREAIAGADAILFATPEYNASIPAS